MQICFLNLRAAFFYLVQMSVNADVLSFTTHVVILDCCLSRYRWKRQFLEGKDNFSINSNAYIAQFLVMCNGFGKRFQKLLFAFSLRNEHFGIDPLEHSKVTGTKYQFLPACLNTDADGCSQESAQRPEPFVSLIELSH